MSFWQEEDLLPHPKQALFPVPGFSRLRGGSSPLPELHHFSSGVSKLFGALHYIGFWNLGFFLLPLCRALVQVYLRVDASNESQPDFLFGYTVKEDECAFKHMPVEVAHPACVPPGVPPGGLYLRVSNPSGEGLLVSALRAGTALTVPQFSSIIQELGLPDIKEGTGNKGGIIRADLVTHLIGHVFKSETAETRDKILQLYLKPERRKPMTAQAQEVLEMVENLDTENAQAFSQMKAWAKEKLENKLRAEGKFQQKKQAAAKATTFAKRFWKKVKLKAPSGKQAAGDRQEPDAPDAPAGPAGAASVEAETAGLLPHASEPPGTSRPSRAEEAARGTPRVGVTPRTLRELLPFKNTDGEMNPFRNDIAPQFYKVTYKISATAASSPEGRQFQFPTCSSREPATASLMSCKVA